MSSYRKYFKHFKTWPIYDNFGPITTNNIAKLKQAMDVNTTIHLGDMYVIKIPKGETFRYWSKIWNKKKVTVKSYTNFSHRGDPIICVENLPWPGNSKKSLTLPSNWLSVIKKTSCTCSTSTIWSKGCQCGGA